MRKVTMQDIADSLGVSRVTVWKVFNNQNGVSSSLREAVLTKAQELGYTKNRIVSPVDQKEKTVSLIVSRPDSSTFCTNIIHRMAQNLSFHSVNLLYTYMPSSYTHGFNLPAILTSNTIHGAIILNIYDSNLIALINTLELPKVFLDTVPQFTNHVLKGDLLLLEGFTTIYKITESVVTRGITDISFVGDIHYAKTNLDRYLGYCQCMKDHHLQINDKKNFTGNIGIFSYRQELNSFLDSLPQLPQAFVCASDYIAHFIQQYLLNHPEKNPTGTIVTGYDGSREYSNVEGLITTADVKTGLLGQRLSMQIIYRMEHPDAPFELTFINPEIIYRDSVIYS